MRMRSKYNPWTLHSIRVQVDHVFNVTREGYNEMSWEIFRQAGAQRAQKRGRLIRQLHIND
jgi:hypothetical protein